MASAVIGALRVNLGLDSAQFGKGLKQSQSRLQNFGNFAKKGLLAVGAGATAAAGAMGMMVRNSINSADEMAKASRSYGVPIEELSRLKYAADLSGVSFGQLGGALRTLNKNMYDASNGTGEARKAFEQLGVNVAGADGELKSATQIMGEVADAIQGIGSETEKAAILGKIFGERYGPQLASLLAPGSEGINKLTREAEDFGEVFTQAMGESAERFNDNMTRMSGAFGNIAAKIAADLLPHLERFSEWLVENAPAIQRWAGIIVQEFIRFGEGLSQLKAEIDAIATGFQEFRDAVTQRVGEVKQAITSFADEIVGIFKAIPGQMAEIGRDIMAGLWQGIKGHWDSLKGNVSGIASGIADRFKSTLGIQSPSKVMAEVGKNVMQGLGNGMEGMQSDVTGIASNIASSVANAFEGVISGSMSVKDALKGLLSQLASVLANQAFQMLFSAGGGGFLGSIFGGIGNLLGFANGGSFTVGGGGGTDSQLVAFRATPGEMVDVRKPGQDRGGGMHVTFGLASDGALNIMPEVRGVSRQESAEAAGRVAQAVPSMVDARTDERETRRIRPRSAY